MNQSGHDAEVWTSSGMDENTEILILGTLPSDMLLAANPQLAV